MLSFLCRFNYLHLEDRRQLYPFDVSHGQFTGKRQLKQKKTSFFIAFTTILFLLRIVAKYVFGILSAFVTFSVFYIIVFVYFEKSNSILQFALESRELRKWSTKKS